DARQDGAGRIILVGQYDHIPWSKGLLLHISKKRWEWRPCRHVGNDFCCCAALTHPWITLHTDGLSLGEEWIPEIFLALWCHVAKAFQLNIPIIGVWRMLQ